MNKVEERIHSLDFLKVICIFMILSLHYFNYYIGGGFYTENLLLGSMKFFLYSLFICASNIFVIIYGYNNVLKNNHFNQNFIKIIKIFGLVLFYCFCLGIIYSFIVNIRVGWLLFKNNVFDLFFVNNYILLVLFSPLINKIFSKIDQKKYLIILLLYTFIICFFCRYICNFLFLNNGYDFPTFILLYLLGGYFKRFPKKISNILLLLIYIICGIVIFCLYGLYIDWAFAYNNIIVIIETCTLFLFFVNIKCKEKKVVKYIVSYTLPIYVIHVLNGIRIWIYRDIFKSSYFCKDLNFLWNYPFTILSIFFLCIFIETIRRIVFKLLINIVKKITKKK